MAKIQAQAPFTPGSKVLPMEVARKYAPSLPKAGEYTVCSASLTSEGWKISLEEVKFLSLGAGWQHPEFPYWGFDAGTRAALSDEPEIPGLAEDLERLSEAFVLPPGFESIDLVPDGSKLSALLRQTN